MKGISLFCSDDKKQLFVSVDPLLCDGPLKLDELTHHIGESEFSDFTVSKNNMLALNETLIAALSQDDNTVIEAQIGEVKASTIIVTTAADKMSATISLTKHTESGLPEINEIVRLIKEQGIVKGFSRKRVRNLLQKAIDAKPSQEVSEVIAKGLPPRNGKDSWIKPLVPNALERILSPQKLKSPQGKNGDKVDMRNLGDILCVARGTIVAKRVAPTSGRTGSTITGDKIAANSGQYKDFKLGANTSVASHNENCIIADVAGQPKFTNGVMSIDDTFTADKGVNVGTGNIKYEGAVIVNGDVTENMEIIATGDVTVNGFVESAYIRSGGDIIITQGATGKMHDEDCQLIASGSVFVQHAQGLDIIAGKDVNVAKQLAYSRVKAKGSVIVGAPDKPMGTLFASSIKCSKAVNAGSIGAISGSALTIDFSDGYNVLCARQDALADLFKQLSSTNANHEIKIAAINNKHIPNAIKSKLLKLNNQLEAERTLLNWLREAQNELHERKREYQQNARVIANKELFPGVSVKLNKKLWRGDKEYLRSRIVLDETKWLYEPLK